MKKKSKIQAPKKSKTKPAQQKTSDRFTNRPEMKMKKPVVMIQSMGDLERWFNETFI